MIECRNGNGLTLGNKIDELLGNCSQPTIFAFCGLTSRLAELLARNECSIPGVVTGESARFFSPSFACLLQYSLACLLRKSPRACQKEG